MVLQSLPRGFCSPNLHQRAQYSHGLPTGLRASNLAALFSIFHTKARAIFVKPKWGDATPLQSEPSNVSPAQRTKPYILDLVCTTSLTSSATTFPFCHSASNLLASYFLNVPPQRLCTFCFFCLECSFFRYCVACSLISFRSLVKCHLIREVLFSQLFHFGNNLKLNDKLQKK